MMEMMDFKVFLFYFIKLRIFNISNDISLVAVNLLSLKKNPTLHIYVQGVQ